MVDHQSPGIPPSEARTASDRSVSLVTEAERLEAIERTLREVAGILGDRLPRRLGEQTAKHRRELEELARELGAAYRAVVQDVEGSRRATGDEVVAMETRLADRFDRLESSITEALAGVRQEVDALRSIPDRVAEGLGAVREAVGEMAAAHASVDARLEEVAAAASLETITGRLDETSEAVAGRLGEAMGKLGADVREAMALVHDRLREAEASLEAVRAESEARSAALQEGLERVDKLAEAVDTIGRRRGFRHVVASDERLRQEQAAMSERLSEAGEVLAVRLDEVKAELEGLRRAARDAQAGLLAEEIRRRVVDELVTEEMVQAMLERVRETFEQRLEELAARVEARLDGGTPGEPVRRRLFRREQA